MSTETKKTKEDELMSPSHHTSSSRFEEVRSTTGHKKFVVPWVRNVLHGIDVLRNPKFNKGLAFTHEERVALRIEGLLPPVVVTQEEQVKRVLISCRAMNTDLDRYQYLMQLMQRNEKLFYRVVQDNVVEMLPLVYTPTVGLACQKFGHVFKTPFGMYITAKDKGRIREILANWPERHVRASVFTDGERILGLGDLGTYGMGIPIGKMALYTACSGVDPRVCLPITLDVGTNNQALLKDPLYTGLRQPRIERKEYDALIDEFIQAMMHRFGPTVLLQFEDFGNSNAFRLLEHYKDKCCTFNDDIQGTASVVLAGVLAALPLTGMKLKEHTFLFYGAGSAGIGIANLIAYAMTRDEGLSMDEARKRIWLVDSTGLVYKERKEGSLNDEKRPYAHSHAPVGKELAEIVKALSPTAIFGVTAQPQTFTKDVIEAMAKASKRPLIFALSNPTSKAECTAEQAYTWTNGTALFASGSPFPAFKLGDKTHYPGQGNNSYIFPGVAHGVISTGSRRVPDHLFFTAAKTLASLVTKDDLANGTLYPPMKDIRKWSLHIATAVGEEIYKENLATVVPKPSSMHQFMQECMYDTEYPSYVH